MSDRPFTLSGLAVQRWKSLVLISGTALSVFLLFRFLPTGTNLSHTDFRPEGNSVEMCDPSNPQFMPVVTVRSPVTMTLPPTVAAVGKPYRASLILTSASGRPVGPEDLAVVHTRKLHLLVVDPTLADYQHLHPEPGAQPGEWKFSFVPKKSGVYRIFGDFTPLATGRGLYGHADLAVEGGPVSFDEVKSPYVAVLSGAEVGALAGKPLELVLTVKDRDGKLAKLGPIMGAYAHLVAFDQGRTGFAHLHPKDTTEPVPEGKVLPELRFLVTFPSAGTYTIWAQLNLEGRETFFPFTLVVKK